MKKFNLVLMALIALIASFATPQANAQLMLAGQKVSVERMDSSETQFGDLAYVRYDFTLIATTDQDIYVSGLMYGSPVEDPALGGMSAGKNTWGLRKWSGQLNMIFGIINEVSVGDHYDPLTHTYRLNAGQEARFSMSYLFTTPVTDFVGTKITGIAYGYSSGKIDQYLSGEAVSPLDTGNFYLQGTPAVPEPSGATILVVALGICLTFHRRFLPF